MPPILGLVVAVAFVVWSTVRARFHPFLALLVASYGFGVLTGQAASDVVERVVHGFGATLGHVGIVVLFGTIIGVFLERSGGAEVLSAFVLRRVGPRHVPLAMAGVGYLVSMPVFCDSAFVLLAPVMIGLARTSRTSVAASAVALALGLLVTHTLVPPTPGPVAAAGLLGAPLGWVVLGGAVVSVGSLIAGWWFAQRFGPYFPVAAVPPPDPVPVVRNDERRLPAASQAFLPILVPIGLMVVASLLEATVAFESDQPPAWLAIGSPTIALLCGVGLAFFLPATFSRRLWSADGWVGEAVASAASILAVTGAGGAFGEVLTASSFASALEGWLVPLRLGVLGPFVLATALKTTQGSSTVAMVTTSSMVAPLLGSLGLDSDLGRTAAVLAIGAGSMMVSHANDSYFWVVTQFSGMDVRTGYRLHSSGTIVVGVTAFLIVWALSLVVT